MKIARFFAVLFALLGMLLLIVCPVLFLVNRNSTVKILESPDGALSCSEELANAVNAADYAAMEQLLYGTPRLNTQTEAQSSEAVLMWDAFCANMRFSYSGNLYLLDSELARDAVITVLDVPQTMELVSRRVTQLLEQRAAEAEDPDALYDAQGNFLPQVVDQAMQEALTQVLQEELPCISYNVTVKLIRRDNRWWVVPDQLFVAAISGTGA